MNYNTRFLSVQQRKETKAMCVSISRDVTIERVKKLVDIRSGMIKDIDNLHVKLQPGNKKTGVNCWTISLLPIVDCVNCSECKWKCYDIRNDLIYPNVIKDRCKNSAIHLIDRKRFWAEIDAQVKANFMQELRINVGGDLASDDFKYVKELGESNPKTMIVFFTKNYDGINAFLGIDKFPENVHPIMSTWQGMEMKNPYNLPQSHVLHRDGTTTAPDFGAYYCTKNCSECAFNNKGCWSLKKGDHVIFQEH